MYRRSIAVPLWPVWSAMTRSGTPASRSRGRQTSPQRVTGYLTRVEPSAEGVAFQHERHRLFEIAETAGCTKASASDYRRGKRTPHVSTWAALGELVGVGINVTLDETRPALTHHKVRDGSARHAEQ